MYVPTYVDPRGQAYGVRLCCYVSVIKPLLLLATSAKLMRHIRIQQRRSTKNEDVNFVRTNPRTAKYHSTDSEVSFLGSSTAIPRLAAQKLCGIHTESVQNFHGIRQIL